jgi:hypothetical protein
MEHKEEFIELGYRIIDFKNLTPIENSYLVGHYKIILDDLTHIDKRVLNIFPYTIYHIDANNEKITWYNNCPKSSEILIQIHHKLNISRPQKDLYLLIEYLDDVFKNSYTNYLNNLSISLDCLSLS